MPMLSKSWICGLHVGDSGLWVPIPPPMRWVLNEISQCYLPKVQHSPGQQHGGSIWGDTN
jgi:hypothetical protein